MTVGQRATTDPHVSALESAGLVKLELPLRYVDSAWPDAWFFTFTAGEARELGEHLLRAAEEVENA